MCVMRRTGRSAMDAIGRYSLAYGSQYRCSACDTWLCADCGDRPTAGPAVRCTICSAPREPKDPPEPPPVDASLWSAGEARTCIRPLRTKIGRCTHSPTDWPTVPGEPEPVRACWTHLSEEERQSCTRARSLRDAERARAWAAGAPERQRLAAEAEAEQRARLAACPCSLRLPEEAGPFSTDYPFPNRCKECDSWLCASCDRVRVAIEGGQCQTCRPQATEPARNSSQVQEGRPHYRITLPSLEDHFFDEAVRLLIRAGARNGGKARVFAVDIDLPICASQAEAVANLNPFDLGSDGEKIAVELLPEGAEVTVAPGLPQPDLSGLGDIDSWWLANGYPASDKRH